MNERTKHIISIEWRHYLTAKRNEVLAQATMWMNLEGIQAEISQKQYDKYCNASTSVNYPRIVTCTETGSGTGDCQRPGEGGIGSYYLMGTEFLFRMMRKL